MQFLQQVVSTLVSTDAHKATKFVSEHHVVRACRRLTRGRIDRRDKRIDVVLTIGKPNYDEREFIKKCKKAGEPFPVKKIQLKFPAKRSAA